MPGILDRDPRWQGSAAGASSRSNAERAPWLSKKRRAVSWPVSSSGASEKQVAGVVLLHAHGMPRSAGRVCATSWP